MRDSPGTDDQHGTFQLGDATSLEGSNPDDDRIVSSIPQCVTMDLETQMTMDLLKDMKSISRNVCMIKSSYFMFSGSEVCESILT